MVETRTKNMAETLNRSDPVSGQNFKLYWQTSGVRKAETNGNSAVKALARARSPLAIRTKVGTTGAKGAAASRAMPTAASVESWKSRANVNARAGVRTKLTGRIQP